MTLNFLVRYWSFFSKVFRKFFGKFFRAIVYISNEKDQSFWKVFWKVFGKFLESFPKISTPPNFRKPQPQVLRTEQITKIRVIQLKIASLIRFTKKHEACVEESLVFVVYLPTNFHKLTSPRNRTATYAIHALE